MHKTHLVVCAFTAVAKESLDRGHRDAQHCLLCLSQGGSQAQEKRTAPGARREKLACGPRLRPALRPGVGHPFQTRRERPGCTDLPAACSTKAVRPTSAPSLPMIRTPPSARAPWAASWPRPLHRCRAYAKSHRVGHRAQSAARGTVCRRLRDTPHGTVLAACCSATNRGRAHSQANSCFASAGQTAISTGSKQAAGRTRDAIAHGRGGSVAPTSPGPAAGVVSFNRNGRPFPRLHGSALSLPPSYLALPFKFTMDPKRYLLAKNQQWYSVGIGIYTISKGKTPFS